VDLTETTAFTLGAKMIGAEVTESIPGYVVFPHPTLSEMIKESVLDAYRRALNA
jgi:dihydrolipoamide dehydrogenase